MPAPQRERDLAEGVAPRLKLWLERDGALVCSDYRVRLLEHVAETGSLAEAAARMGLSYRRAWGKVREIERNLGVALVESEAGGRGGGGSRLTEAGRLLVARFRAFERRLQADLDREFAEVFGRGED